MCAGARACLCACARVRVGVRVGVRACVRELCVCARVRACLCCVCARAITSEMRLVLPVMNVQLKPIDGALAVTWATWHVLHGGHVSQHKADTWNLNAAAPRASCGLCNGSSGSGVPVPVCVWGPPRAKYALRAR
jgi:hypothetical protein